MTQGRGSGFWIFVPFWGIGLLAEAGALAYELPVSTMVELSTVLTVGTIGVLFVVSIQVAKRAKRSAPVL